MIGVTQTPASRSDPTQPGLDEECRHAVQSLRVALYGLYKLVGADPDRPQEVSRQFKLDKSLTWKISKILRCDDTIDVVGLVPGNEGMTRLLNGIGAVGGAAATPAIEAVREAMRGFDAMIARHAGDRATLGLYLDSMRPNASMQESRRLAYLGNSGVLGLQTRVRFATRIIAPSAVRPDHLDIALVTGVRDLRRLRPTATWPIYRFVHFKDDLSPDEFPRDIVPLEEWEGQQPDDWLMPAWCSAPVPPIRVTRSAGTVVYELVGGPVGRTGEADLTFGYMDRGAVPRHATMNDRRGQFATSLTTPTETMLIDTIVHRSLPELEGLSARVIAQIPGFAGDSGLVELPMSFAFERLQGTTPDVTTPLIDDYAPLVASVVRRGGWNPADFYGLRLTIEHPPLHATILTTYDLPIVPG